MSNHGGLMLMPNGQRRVRCSTVNDDGVQCRDSAMHTYVPRPPRPHRFIGPEPEMVQR